MPPRKNLKSPFPLRSAYTAFQAGGVVVSLYVVIADKYMFEIIQIEGEDHPDLKAFSAGEWPVVDKEHFGDQQVDFSKPKFALKAIEDGQIVGYLAMTLDMGVLHIDSLLVGERHRGKGVAKRLLVAAEDRARDMGCHKAWLETGKDWKARIFYEKQGYALRVELPNYYAHQDFIIMDKEL